MADDRKRSENVCAKVTERMALDLLRECDTPAVGPMVGLRVLGFQVNVYPWMPT